MARAVTKMRLEIDFQGYVPVQVVSQVKETVKALMESQGIKVSLEADFDYEVRSNLTNGELNALNGISSD
jgi:hypothetical protein